jgi:DNA-3-methyladenine glycosylase
MTNKRFSRAFFRQTSTVVAKEMLGAYLHRVLDGEELIGKIVETEAYRVGDEASHAYRGKTQRNAVMFGEGGFSYVYFTYGMHYCFNITANEENLPEAVLVRAVEPIKGIETMRTLRQKAIRDRDISNGPGKLCQALSLSRNENGIDLIESDTLFLTRGKSPVSANHIGVSTRIGINIAQEHLWRFFMEGNEYVSRTKPSIPGKPVAARRRK